MDVGTSRLGDAELGDRLGVRLGSTDLQTTQVAIPYFSGTAVAVEYNTLPGNQPNANGNFVALWQDSVVPWTTPALKQETIPGNTPSGSLIVTPVSITKNAYTIGYGVGPGVGTVCASASIQPGGQTTAPKALTISLSYVGSNSLLVHYESLPGYQPGPNGNWIGLWQGEVQPYGAPAPLGRANVDSTSNIGDVAINNLALGVNTTYSVVYFMGGGLSTAAAILSFNTSDTNGLTAEKAEPIRFQFTPSTPEAENPSKKENDYGQT